MKAGAWPAAAGVVLLFRVVGAECRFSRSIKAARFGSDVPHRPSQLPLERGCFARERMQGAR